MTPQQVSNFAMTKLGELFYRYELAYCNAAKADAECLAQEAWPKSATVARLARLWAEADEARATFLKVLLARLES